MPFQHDSLLVKGSNNDVYLVSYGGECDSGKWTSNLEIFSYENNTFRSVMTQDLDLKKDGHKIFMYNNSLYLFSGLDNIYFSERNEIYSLVTETENSNLDYLLQSLKKFNNVTSVKLKWVNAFPSLDDPKPAGRRLYGLAMVGSKIFIVGGRSAIYKDSTLLNDTWNFDLESKSWTEMKNAILPEALSGISLIHDKKKNRLIAFGGITSEAKYVNKIFELDITSEDSKWNEIKTVGAGDAPCGRERHASLYNESENCMYVVGGWGIGGCRNDVWQLNLQTNEWKELYSDVKGVDKRYGHVGFIYDGAIWVHGGKSTDWKNIESISKIEGLRIEHQDNINNFQNDKSRPQGIDSIQTKEAKESIEAREAKEAKQAQNTKEIIESKEVKEAQNAIVAKQSQTKHEIQSSEVNQRNEVQSAEIPKSAESENTVEVHIARDDEKSNEADSTLIGVQIPKDQRNVIEERLATKTKLTTLDMPQKNIRRKDRRRAKRESLHFDNLKEETLTIPTNIEELKSASNEIMNETTKAVQPKRVPMFGMGGNPMLQNDLMAEMAKRQKKG